MGAINAKVSQVLFVFILINEQHKLTKCRGNITTFIFLTEKPSELSSFTDQKKKASLISVLNPHKKGQAKLSWLVFSAITSVRHEHVDTSPSSASSSFSSPCLLFAVIPVANHHNCIPCN